jgi:type VI protein secretion system component VasK
VSSNEVRAYAWNWFSLHAGQRLQLVNFWLVAVAFLVAAFVQSEIDRMRPIAAGVALIGAIASVAFQRLDVRTRQLSQVAEDALREFEDEWVAQGANELIALVKRSNEARESWVDSYRLIIQGLQLTVSLVFIAAFIYVLAS